VLGWWQPLNLVAAARLRLAMELSCDERAAAEPRERAALARCLIKVAEWNVRDDGAVLATMASRGSALRRRLESLLDDAPRSRRAVGPWLAVTTVAVPVVCLAPVVTIASLSRVPAAAVQLVRHAPAPEAPAAPGVPFPARPAPRTSTTASAAPPGAAAADRAPAPEIALDEPVPAGTSEPMPTAVVPEIALDEPVPTATSEAMPTVAGLKAVAAPAAPPTRLRDAIADARIITEPAPWRTRLEGPDRARGALSWIAQYVRFDSTRPKLDIADPTRVALSRAQRIAFDSTRQK
jgi:hypothetical protein